ncbi:hypothetical protein F5X68DRAFT_188634 [Plectosphaerella plurivora]|uniref:2EXR domain-containing protein n=1 Tax=Plectosphaerella plurivora TaxID=936078 RepID=A0A9P8VGY8_9PEZI|nr:hypothetical protein F5X68DRAFT_188634 [Plectosphaerella plurivora]
MTRPKKRRTTAAENLMRLAKSRRRLRAQRAINATLEKRNDQRHEMTQQHQQLLLAVVAALDKNTTQAKEVPEVINSVINTINGCKEGIFPSPSRSQALVLTQNLDAAMPRSGGPIGFNKLPLELRLMIWELALPDRRVFEPRLREMTDPWEHIAVYLQQGYPPPVIRGVCKEAWQVTETHGCFCFGLTGHAHFGFWFNPSKDLVFMSRSSEEEETCDLEDYENDYIAVVKSSGARHLAWSSWMIHNSPSDIAEVLKGLPGCETITAVVEAVTMEDGTNVKAMYPLDDEDTTTMCVAASKSRGSVMSWAEERKYILRKLRKFTGLGDKLPRLEGLEVVRSKQVHMRDKECRW